jgi:hypothetical protein
MKSAKMPNHQPNNRKGARQSNTERSQCFDVYRRKLWRGSYCGLHGVASVRSSQTDHLVDTRAKGEAPALATGT